MRPPLLEGESCQPMMLCVKCGCDHSRGRDEGWKLEQKGCPQIFVEGEDGEMGCSTEG